MSPRANSRPTDRSAWPTGPARFRPASGWNNWSSGWARYPIVSLEDVYGEDEWAAWRTASDAFGRLQLLGDDLFATNAERLGRGIAEGVGNSVLVKVNQAGSVTKADRVVNSPSRRGTRRW